MLSFIFIDASLSDCHATIIKFFQEARDDELLLSSQMQEVTGSDCIVFVDIYSVSHHKPKFKITLINRINLTLIYVWQWHCRIFFAGRIQVMILRGEVMPFLKRISLINFVDVISDFFFSLCLTHVLIFRYLKKRIFRVCLKQKKDFIFKSSPVEFKNFNSMFWFSSCYKLYKTV